MFLDYFISELTQPYPNSSYFKSLFYQEWESADIVCESCACNLGKVKSADSLWNRGYEKNGIERTITERFYKRCESCGKANERTVQLRWTTSPLLLFLEIDQWSSRFPLAGLTVNVV